MTVAAQTRFLHVANGTSTTGTIDAAGLPGARSIWADPLYEGPVPAGLSDAELLDVRERFLAPPEDARDPVNDLRQWRAAIARHESYGELVLWFEHDLFDQLNLIQLLTWIREHLPEAKPVSLICIGSFPGRPRFMGLGELTPRELAPLLEARQPVEASQYALARRAWQAFREPTPIALDELRHGDTSALPYLAAAIARFLQEYPWTSDGLSRTERRLLELASGDGITLRNAFPRMQEGEDVYCVTDGSLDGLAESLSEMSPPLLTLDRSGAETGRVLRGRVTITGAGRSVLSGQQDRVAIAGIDRWLGGVHLESGSRIWRWNDARQCMS
jgi:hypothetical protein